VITAVDVKRSRVIVCDGDVSSLPPVVLLPLICEADVDDDEDVDVVDEDVDNAAVDDEVTAVAKLELV
jgi:hypothetical protein